MNRKELKTVEEVDEFVKPLATGGFVIDIRALPEDGGYVVEWQEHKSYTSYADGKEYPDELWRTEDGRLLLIQDIEPEHCRNILRMILRNERLAEARLNTLFESLMESLDMSADDTTDLPPPNPSMLH